MGSKTIPLYEIPWETVVLPSRKCRRAREQGRCKFKLRLEGSCYVLRWEMSPQVVWRPKRKNRDDYFWRVREAMAYGGEGKEKLFVKDEAMARVAAVTVIYDAWRTAVAKAIRDLKEMRDVEYAQEQERLRDRRWREMRAKEARKEDQRNRTRTYLIEAVGTDKVKIGKSHDVKARLQALQATSPTPLRLIGSIHGDRYESALHGFFNAERSHGEWFTRSPRLEKFIRWVSIERPLPKRADWETIFGEAQYTIAA